MSPDPAAAEVLHRPFNKALPSILFLTSLFLLNFTSRIIFAPLLPTLEQDLNLTHSDSGSFFLFISSGYFVSILASGFVSARLSHKKTIVLSTMIAGCVLIVLAFCTTLAQLRLALFSLGLGAGLYLPSGLAFVTSVVPPAYLARAIAVHELAPNIGSVAAPLAVAFLTVWLSWQQCLWFLGGLLIIMGALYWIRGSTNAGFGVRPDYAICREIVGTWDFWLMVVLFATAICSALGIYIMLPLYLVAERGLDQFQANQLVAWSRVTAVCMPFVGGWLGDRVGNRRLMIYALLLTGLFTIPIGLSSGILLLVFVIVQAMLAVSFFPSALAVLSRVGTDRSGNVALSLCIPMAFLLGGGVMPFLIGLIGDSISLGFGFICSGVLSLGVGGLAFSSLNNGTTASLSSA